MLRFRHGAGQSVGWGEPIYTAVSLRIREHLERSALCKVHQQRHLVVDVKHLACKSVLVFLRILEIWAEDIALLAEQSHGCHIFIELKAGAKFAAFQSENGLLQPLITPKHEACEHLARREILVTGLSIELFREVNGKGFHGTDASVVDDKGFSERLGRGLGQRGLCFQRRKGRHQQQ